MLLKASSPALFALGFNETHLGKTCTPCLMVQVPKLRIQFTWKHPVKDPGFDFRSPYEASYWIWFQFCNLTMVIDLGYLPFTGR